MSNHLRSSETNATNMEIQILSSDELNGYCSIRAACGRTTAFVGFSRQTGMVNVCTENASHRVWRSGGRSFANFTQATDAYRSSEMKTIIGLAQRTFEEVAPAETPEVAAPLPSESRGTSSLTI